MEYVYAGMWLLVGVILIFRMGKENKIFYLAGAFFLILGGWWLANAFTEQNLFDGTWGIVLRVITAAALSYSVRCFGKPIKKIGLLLKIRKNRKKKQRRKPLLHQRIKRSRINGNSHPHSSC